MNLDIRLFLIVFLLLILDFGFLLAQKNTKIDSLLFMLEKAESKDKIEIYFQLSDLYRNEKKLDLALDAASKALDLGQKNGYKQSTASGKYRLSDLYFQKNLIPQAQKNGLEALKLYEELEMKISFAQTSKLVAEIFQYQKNYEQTIQYYAKTIPIYREVKDLNAQASSHFNLGYAYKLQKNYVKALENYLISLEIWENMKNKNQVAQVMDYLAELYEEQSNFTKSVDYYHKSLKIHEELSNKYKVARTLSNIGINCEQLGDYDKALKFDLRALTLFQEMDYKKDMARVYNSLGSAYIAKKDYMKAFDNLSNALNISERINDPFSKALTYNNLAHSYDKTNQPDKAIIFANKALVLAKKYNFANEIEKANLILSNGYASKNNFEQAYQYQKQHLEMRDSLFRQEQNKQLVEMTSKYESEKKEKQITALQLKDKQNQITIVQQQVGTTLILSVLVVFMILILFLYSRFRIKKKNAELLLIKNTEIRGRNLELQELSTQLQESLSEKETLLKEIHHRVKNNLQIISSLLNLQTHTLTDPKALEAVRDGQNRVKSMALIHQNLYQAENLASIDFQNYVEQLLSVLSITYEAAHKEIISSVQAQNIHLDIDTAIPIGLIINELVSNAYKYAFLKQEKGSIDIELAQLTINDFRLTVQDNGVGLQTNIDWENPPTLGLKLVNILTNQINGILHIENQMGTRFIIDFTKSEDKKVA